MNVSSEVAAKNLKRYTSAMLIVCIIWSFVGFVFTRKYLRADLFGSSIGGIILCTIIVQIERQIILATHINNLLFAFRTIIAIVMACIGSIVVDQIFFKGDIELAKIQLVNNRVNKILPDRQEELKAQLSELDSSIRTKEADRGSLTEEISKHPTIKYYNTQSVSQPIVTTKQDSLKGTSQSINVVRTTNISANSIPNPNINLIGPLDKQIAGLRDEKLKKEERLVKLRTELQDEINNKQGFLDELEIMFQLLKNSGVALFVYSLWFIFLTGIELFIVVSKWKTTENDYDLTIRHHMEIQIKKLELLAKGVQS